MAGIAFLIAIGKCRIEPVGHFLYSMTLLGAPAYDLSWTLEREIIFYFIAAVWCRLAGFPRLRSSWPDFRPQVGTLAIPWSYHLISTTQADFWLVFWCL